MRADAIAFHAQLISTPLYVWEATELGNLLVYRFCSMECDCEELTAVPQQSWSDDAKLLARVQRGDEQAMGYLFDRYSKIVYSIALRVLRDTASANDMLEETFMQIWHHPCKFIPSRRSRLLSGGVYAQPFCRHSAPPQAYR